MGEEQGAQRLTVTRKGTDAWIAPQVEGGSSSDKIDMQTGYVPTKEKLLKHMHARKEDELKGR